MLKKYPEKIKLIIKNFPLRSHKFAREAAAAALAADRQGKFWEFNENLFKNYKELDESKIAEIARDLKLDRKKFEKDITDPEFQKLIDRDARDGNLAKVTGIPTVFVNGKRIKNRSFAGIAQAIEAEVEKLKNKK